MSALPPLAPEFSAWIESHMPELGGLRGVRIRCVDRVPFEWLPGFLPGVRGLTLWNTVYLEHQCCPIDPANRDHVELLLHELVHVAQFRRAPLLFPVVYLIEFARRGYYNIPAEVEARRRAAELIVTYLKDQGHQP